MPIYEYRCKDCGEHLEVVQAFADDPLTECPNCSGTLKKVFNSVGIAFKGSGFYKNDSRSSSSTSAARTGGSSTDGGGSSSTDGGGSSSTDSSSSSSSDSASSSSSSSGDGGSSSSSTKTETTPA